MPVKCRRVIPGILKRVIRMIKYNAYLIFLVIIPTIIFREVIIFVKLDHCRKLEGWSSWIYDNKHKRIHGYQFTHISLTLVQYN